MRFFFVGAALLFTTTASAQSRWTISAGPEWYKTGGGGRFYGGRLRAEFDVIRPTSMLRLRLEAGGYWSPTQSFSSPYFDGSSISGFDQSLDLTFGATAAIAPLPRARFSPYVMMGAFARQSWTQRSTWLWNPDGSLARGYRQGSETVGDIDFHGGIGIRARISGRTFQLEMRQFRRRSLTLGTNLPF